MSFDLRISDRVDNERALSSTIRELRRRPNADTFLDRGDGRVIQVTDSSDDRILSAGNRTTIRNNLVRPDGRVIAGFAQEVGTRAVWINLDHYKPSLNILVHELLHHVTSGSGAMSRHSKVFYAEVLDALELMSVAYTPNMDLGGYSPRELRRRSRRPTTTPHETLTEESEGNGIDPDMDVDEPDLHLVPMADPDTPVG